MSASATPKQGDHVFNAVETAILHPFDTIRSFPYQVIDGQRFLHSYLLQSYSLAKQQAETKILIDARKFVASASDEQFALRELKNLSSRHPALARISPSLLREIHRQNATDFGNAAARFEADLLSVIKDSLEAAIAGRGPRPPRNGPAPTLGISYQLMLDAAYDPSSALVVITNSMSRENASMQGAFHAVILKIAETLDRPGMWKDPYTAFDGAFSGAGRTVTGGMLAEIRDVLARLDFIKAPGMLLASRIRDEINWNANLPKAGTDYGLMLHLLHSRLQRRGPGA